MKLSLQEMPVFYVYVYFLPNGDPCWIGKGSGDRYKAHLWSSPEHNKTNKDFLALLQNARDLGVELPVVIARANLTHREALDLERLMIEVVGCRRDGTGPLLNYAKGQAADQEAREKMRIANVGKKRSPEAREKMRQAKLGKKQSPDFIRKRMVWAPGSRWITDGTRDQRLVAGAPMPEGWTTGRAWGGKWITDGTRNRRTSEEVPPDGWWFGRSGDFREKISMTKRAAKLGYTIKLPSTLIKDVSTR